MGIGPPCLSWPAAAACEGESCPVVARWHLWTCVTSHGRKRGRSVGRGLLKTWDFGSQSAANREFCRKGRPPLCRKWLLQGRTPAVGPVFRSCHLLKALVSVDVVFSSSALVTAFPAGSRPQSVCSACKRSRQLSQKTVNYPLKESILLHSLHSVV